MRLFGQSPTKRQKAIYRGVTTDVAAAGGDFDEAVRSLIIAMLQAPEFLYRGTTPPAADAIDRDDAALAMDSPAVAAAISFALTGGPPDARLQTAADDGELRSIDQVAPHVDRLLAATEQPSEAVRQHSLLFAADWLNLDRLANLRPNAQRFESFSPELAADFRRETLAYFDQVVWREHLPISRLLSAPLGMWNRRLAEHYHVDASVIEGAFDGVSPDDLVPIDLTGESTRGGLLTHASLLSIGGDEASMVTRGLFVLRDLLHGEIGSPPPGLDTTPVHASPGQSNRLVALTRVQSESCGGCHRRFEPLAFGLEQFDGLGRYREVDHHGNPTRQDGAVLFPGESQPRRFASSAELMELLADHPRVRRSLVRKITQFVIGRPLVAGDAALIDQIDQAAAQAGGTYDAVLREITLSPLVIR